MGGICCVCVCAPSHAPHILGARRVSPHALGSAKIPTPECRFAASQHGETGVKTRKRTSPPPTKNKKNPLVHGVGAQPAPVGGSDCIRQLSPSPKSPFEVFILLISGQIHPEWFPPGAVDAIEQPGAAARAPGQHRGHPPGVGSGPVWGWTAFWGPHPLPHPPVAPAGQWPALAGDFDEPPKRSSPVSISSPSRFLRLRSK